MSRSIYLPYKSDCHDNPKCQTLELNTEFVNKETGPGFLSTAVGSDIHRVRFFSTKTFYPISHKNREFFRVNNCYEVSCSEHFPESYAFHIFSQTSEWTKSPTQGNQPTQTLIKKLALDVDIHNEASNAP